MNTLTARLHTLRPASAAVATVAAAALLLTGCSSDCDDTPACHVVRSKGGDLVPSGGGRPCVLYGTGRQRVAGDDARPAAPGGASKNRSMPKALSAAKPKMPAPKAPAVKPPSLVRR
ncbi:hypothetical protein [Streptomyces sp. NPDC048650]|uniref:hypothetical protein n=1 Tax=Streptomyces sp. NPDC048650 TaxID=3365583 RepID=UPI0037107123